MVIGELQVEGEVIHVVIRFCYNLNTLIAQREFPVERFQIANHQNILFILRELNVYTGHHKKELYLYCVVSHHFKITILQL